MRKFAGKCVALFLALLMLLTSMPLTALAEAISSESSGVIHFDVDQPSTAAGTEGENADNSAGAGSALQVAQEAAEDNPTSGKYVELFRASLKGSNPIKTGDEFNYEIGYQFNAPPTYKDASGEAQPAYSRLTDIQITVTVPDGIEILDAKATHVSGNTYTVAIAVLRSAATPAPARKSSARASRTTAKWRMARLLPRSMPASAPRPRWTGRTSCSRTSFPTPPPRTPR